MHSSQLPILRSWKSHFPQKEGHLTHPKSLRRKYPDPHPIQSLFHSTSQLDRRFLTQTPESKEKCSLHSRHFPGASQKEQFSQVERVQTLKTWSSPVTGAEADFWHTHPAEVQAEQLEGHSSQKKDEVGSKEFDSTLYSKILFRGNRVHSTQFESSSHLSQYSGQSGEVISSVPSVMGLGVAPLSSVPAVTLVSVETLTSAPSTGGSTSWPPVSWTQSESLGPEQPSLLTGSHSRQALKTGDDFKLTGYFESPHAEYSPAN